jgi:SAM-dependent methyltransferase
MPGKSAPLGQHNVEIYRNRDAWANKPELRAAYSRFYQVVADRVQRPLSAPILEIGSGIGAIKEFIPDCITSDLFANTWLDRQENCYQLNFASESLSHLVLVDVWHHLRYPGTALEEFKRVLAPGGRIILLEPACSLLGHIVYRFFHHEPVAMRAPITWYAPPGFSAAQADYYAAQGAATRLFWHAEHREQLQGWNIREVTPIVSFPYLASGGFSGPHFSGPLLGKILRGCDFIAGYFPRLFAARLLVVLEKP